MASYEEQCVTLEQRDAGQVRVRAVYALPGTGIFPRLGIRIGFAMRELAADHEGVKPLEQYKLRDLAGELRLTQHSDAVGPLRWLEQRGGVYSNSHGLEQTVELAVDLDPWHLEKLEAWRKGASPQFWLQLWPSFVSAAHGWYDTRIESFAFTVPRDTWLELLPGLGVGRFAVLEVPFTEPDREMFKRAVDHLDEAQLQIRDGHYNESVATCRKAVDAMFSGLGKRYGKRSLPEYLTPVTDEERAEAYSKILTGIKNLTHLPHHTSSGPRVFTRVEAVAILQMTQNALALVGALVARNGAETKMIQPRRGGTKRPEAGRK